MKGLSNFHLSILVIGIVTVMAVGIWAVQPNDDTREPTGGEIAILADTGIPRMLSAAEIRDRFAGQIVEGVHETRNFSFTHYYSPAGALISVRSGRSKNHGTWHAGDDDRLCIHFDGDDELCRAVIEIDGVIKKIVETRRGKTKIIVTFKSFRTGGPDDL